MVEIARISRSAAKENPGLAFACPADLASEVMLTRGEKIGALERWRIDVLHQLAATGEGMRTLGASETLCRLLYEIDTVTRELTRSDDLMPAK